MNATQENLIERCKFELATNFDCPAEQIIRVYAARIGMSAAGLKKLLADRCESN